MDYGHQAYLDTLSNRRHIVLRALEKLETRTAEVLYEKEKWCKWVREVQQEEEANREKESKKVKLEAAMFKRYRKRMQARLKAQREKEERKRQDAFLEAVYQERISASTDSDKDDEMWDPIEDIAEDERNRYIDLIKHFLWMEVLIDADEDPFVNTAKSSDPAVDVGKLIIAEDKKPKKSNKKSKSKGSTLGTTSNKTKSQNTSDSPQGGQIGQSRILTMMDEDVDVDVELDEGTGPDKNNIETEVEIRRRLKEGVEKNYNDVNGPIVVGTLENPHGTHLKTSPLADDEINSLIRDIREIKLLLFCRLLLSHASLLPAALRSASVEEFLSDPEIAGSDLRDICLRVEQPSLQDIRDACADLIRGDEPELEDDEGDLYEEESFEDAILQDRKYGHLQTPGWFLMNMITQRQRMIGNEGQVSEQQKKSDQQQRKQGRMKVQICGKSIWNYSSELSMSRDGWLQFSVLAKDCDLRHAVELCRNWDEFSQINFLTVWQYFPASNWLSFGSDRLTQQLHELGFFPYFQDFEAQKHSRHLQVGSRSQHRRQHSFVEARNIIVGHMKRKDSVTRRFLQYITMRPGELLVVVRDGRTGKIITAPSEDELWTWRQKQGIGRASKNERDVLLEVGHEYFDMVDVLRKWRLGFDDYYDVWIWDFVPCNNPINLDNVIVQDLLKAWRITKPRDLYARKEPFLRTLTRDEDTMRVRSICPGEQAISLWEVVNNPSNTFFLAGAAQPQAHETDGDGRVDSSTYLFYNEADAFEDMVLFPDELVTPNANIPFKEVSNPINRLETSPATIINVLAESARKISKMDKDSPYLLEDDFNEGLHRGDFESGSENDNKRLVSHWSLPPLWENAIMLVNHSHLSTDRKLLLHKVGLLSDSSMIRGGINDLDEFESKLKEADKIMIMEKDRGAAFVEAFHAGDLEPGAQEKYNESSKIICNILGSTQPGISTTWVWFLAEILDWLELRADYETYGHNPRAGWPHPFVTQDLVKAFVSMAMFFPDLEHCKAISGYFKSEDGFKYHDSFLFNPLERSQRVPNIRTRVSFRNRPKAFWNEWEEVLENAKAKDTFYSDAFPMKWSIAIRPIIAKLYLAGIIAPAYMQNSPQIVPGFAIANTEPHRPDELDLFIDYTDREKVSFFPTKIPGYVGPNDWPVLLPFAQDFASKNGSARFAILRVWSAPHFYPAMFGDQNRKATSFLDSAARSWVWRFIPKDMPVSEWSMYNTLKMRLDLLQKQFTGRVIHRNEVILVMGVDQLDLLKYVTAVTFAIQTKPWHREIDLWKSFINDKSEFLEGLDPYWLD
ncbi:hypothetical protein F5B20DRAFT_586346 [Whalleya microplaca]|nr:hypothetical protein F5B20DRAFT_586346 [Whalleya microplaca]